MQQIFVQNFIRDIQDFPRPGISFKDITPLLSDHEASERCLGLLISTLSERHIDKVVAIESRGFFYGTLLAQRLKAGFVPVRKPNKLPFTTISETYALKYGTDTLEMHTDAIKKGDRVLIHDDVLATGGTAKAACDLVTRAGGIIVQCNFIIELEFLEGRQRISDREVFAVVKY